MNVLMAIAMPSMLAGRPNPVLDVVWLVTFAAACRNNSCQRLVLECEWLFEMDARSRLALG